ncbi:hypothetical protein OCOJLMKI_4722 [Methylobacterium iners]|uniref:HTH cro/C1-type domain-containing protein n=1 Tax=Methylobacterium iners TaxID=418707 RepID=A0ABQ4S2X4_9HYPH|nr:hypothetical protein OCOJLMKI_4722 [Methylobacterium iners]
MITSRPPCSSPDPQDVLRAAIEEEGSASAVARRLGVSPAYLLDVRHGRRPASNRLLEAMGLRRVIVSLGTEGRTRG